MSQLAIYGPMRTGESFHVHLADCADCKKPLYRGMTPIKLDPADSPGSANETLEQTVILDIYSDMIEDDSHWDLYAAEFRFFPCVKRGRP